MKKRLFAMLLIMCLTLTFLPTDVWAADSALAEVTAVSGDPVAGYYVEYTMNGNTYRSDAMGSKFNMRAWQRFSEEDRMEIMYCFAFAPGKRIDQFGDEGSEQMTDWVNDATGWTQAAQVLRDRIEMREFPKLKNFYDDMSNSTAMPDELLEGDLAFYSYLPEVRALTDRQAELEQIYIVGSYAYSAMSDAKMEQVKTAVQSISAGLISLISERVLVPAISPAGLAGLSASAAEEIMGLVDKAMGISDSLYESVVGPMPSSGAAREIIDKLWELIRINEQIANKCMAEVLQLKEDIRAGIPAASVAVENYKNQLASLTEAATAPIEEVEELEVTDPSNYAPISPETGTDEEKRLAMLSAAITRGEEYKDRLNALKNNLTSEAEEARELLPEDVGSYPDWPQNADLSGEFPDMEYFNHLPGEHYDTVRTTMPEHITAALTKLNQDIIAFNTYDAAANSLLGSLPAYEEEYTVCAAELLAVNKALRELGSPEQLGIPTAKVILGSITDLKLVNDKSVDENILDVQRDISQIELNAGRWDAECEEYEAAVTESAEAYAETQTNLVNAWEQFRTAREARKTLLDSNLPDYVSAQYVNDDGSHLAVPFQNMNEGHRSRNPVIYDRYLEIKSGGNQWEDQNAQIMAWGAELDTLTTNLDRYERQMEVAQSHIAYYDSVMRAERTNPSVMNLFVAETTGALRLPGEISNEYYDIASDGMYETKRIKRAELLRALSDDMNGSDSFSTDLAIVSDELAAWEKRYDALPDTDKIKMENTYRIWYDMMNDFYVSGNSSYVGLNSGVNQYPFSPYLNELATQKSGKWLYEISNQIYSQHQRRNEMDELYTKYFGSYMFGGDGLLTDPERNYIPPFTLTPATGQPTSVGIGVGATATINVLLRGGNGEVPTAPDLIWKTENPNVVQIASTAEGSAVIRGVANGTTNVTVRAEASYLNWISSQGTYEYMPTPLSFTVTVGSGVPAESVFKTLGYFRNFGTAEEPVLYQVSNAADRVEVSCEFSAYLSQNEAVLSALYDSSGKLLDMGIFSSGQHTLSVSGSTEAEYVNFKVFALGNGFVPLSEPLISERINLN